MTVGSSLKNPGKVSDKMENQSAEIAVINDFRIAKYYEGTDPELLADFLRFL